MSAANVCEACGGTTRVVDSRPTGAGVWPASLLEPLAQWWGSEWTVRRRTCIGVCGAQPTLTLELSVADLRGMLDSAHTDRTAFDLLAPEQGRSQA